MSLAILPRSPSPRSYCVVEYTTADGVTLRCRVSREVAEVLADEGKPLREVTLTDLAGRKRRKKDDGRPGLDPELMLEGVARRVARRRTREGKGSPWEGPRYQFALLLGESRPGWDGGPVRDSLGRCGVCHGAKLLAVAYCLCCDRSGRDAAISGGNRDASASPCLPAPRFRPRLRPRKK